MSVKRLRRNTKFRGSVTSSAPHGIAYSSGDYGVASNAGVYGSAINKGFRGTASNSGDYGSASNSGERGLASNSGEGGSAFNEGWRGSAVNGSEGGSASNAGEGGFAAAFAPMARVMGTELGTCLIAAYWDAGTAPRVAVGTVGEGDIKPGVWYEVDPSTGCLRVSADQTTPVQRTTMQVAA